MAKALLEPRIKYLDDASNNLLWSSPAISAHLQVVRQSIIGNRDGAYHSNRGPSCTACGNLLIRGRSCEDITNASAKRTRKGRLAKTTDGVETVKLRCHKCNSTTVIEGVNPKSEHRRPHETPLLSADVKSTPATADSPNTISTSEGLPKPASRKRPRSKKSTLQSMLANRKPVVPEVTGGFGLDLMDLMKP